MGITDTQLAWFAAVVELRGRIKRIDSPLRRNPQLVLRVRSKEIRMMVRLAELTGVVLSYQEAKILEDKARRGCTEHCPEPHIHYAPELPRLAEWAVTGAGAAIVLFNLLPHLLEQESVQEFVDDALSRLPVSGRGRKAVDDSIARLGALGWVIPAGMVPEPVEDVDPTPEAVDS